MAMFASLTVILVEEFYLAGKLIEAVQAMGKLSEAVVVPAELRGTKEKEAVRQSLSDSAAIARWLTTRWVAILVAAMFYAAATPALGAYVSHMKGYRPDCCKNILQDPVRRRCPGSKCLFSRGLGPSRAG
jgi:hypothetical protein